jgi:hypothetical protein
MPSWSRLIVDSDLPWRRILPWPIDSCCCAISPALAADQERRHAAVNRSVCKGVGELAVSLKQRGNRPRTNCVRWNLKARFRPDDAAAALVTLNVGWCAGGDVLETAIAVGAEARAIIASQAASGSTERCRAVPRRA